MMHCSQYHFGDMVLSYITDEEGCVSMTIVPAGTEGKILRKEYRPEPLVQIHARCDQFTNGYGNGSTLACTPASEALKLVSQHRAGNTVITTVSDGNGRTVHHRAAWEEGREAITVSCIVENTGKIAQAAADAIAIMRDRIRAMAFFMMIYLFRFLLIIL